MLKYLRNYLRRIRIKTKSKYLLLVIGFLEYVNKMVVFPLERLRIIIDQKDG